MVKQDDTIPRNAYGDIAPFLMDTMMVIPDSRKGTEKSMTELRTWLMINAVMIISAFPSISSRIRPFHSPVS